MKFRTFGCLGAAAGLALLAGCSSDSESPKTDAEYQQEIATSVHQSLLAQLDELEQAAKDLQAAAPATSGRGWDATSDAAAINSMKAAWMRARTAYEHIEGAVAPLFSDEDFKIDARYEDFLEAGPDTNLFDGQGVTGMHAIERILWADAVPQRVIDLESTLTGYVAPSFPKTEQEAAEFKSGLSQQFVTDVHDLREKWAGITNLDLPGAFRGLIDLMNEQREKVNKASTNEEESRYSQRTMVDIRDNLAGTTTIYALFTPWLQTKSAGNPNGPATDSAIKTGFQKLDAAYKEVTGDAIPQPPATWSATNPSPDDLASPFGRLYTSVQNAVDPNKPDSVVSAMTAASNLVGFEEP
jgi:iron uptake system component EfeO